MSAPLDFYLVTDLHHYAQSLGISGKAFDMLNGREQKCLAETGAIIDSAFDTIIADEKTKIVLVAGDVSCNGAMESHLDLIPRLQRLKDAGKLVCVITATHDYNPKPERCDGDTLGVATPTEREDLRGLYQSFGREQAYSEHYDSMSYAVKLDKGYRVLCLNDDGDRTFCGYSDDQMKWILERIAEAKTENEYIFAMTHHPCLPPFALYPLFSQRDMLGDWQKTTTILADAGLELIFTGHTHMQNIALKQTEKGNKFYDVNTASLVGFPSVMRKVRIDSNTIDIKSIPIENFNWNLNGMTVDEYMRHHFSFFLNDIMDSAANDIEHLSELATGFSMTREQVYKLRLPIRIVGKRLHTWTLGRLGRFLHVSKSVDDSVKDIILKDLFLEIIENIYYGDEPYTPDTAVYKAMSAVLDKAAKLAGHFVKSANLSEYVQAVKKSLYDEPPADWDLTIERMQ